MNCSSSSCFLAVLSALTLSVSAACAQSPNTQDTEIVPVTKSGVRPPNTPGTRVIAPNKLTSVQAMAKILADRDAYFQNARKEVYKGAREILAQDLDEIDRGLKFRKVIHGNTNIKTIALTFDDGPHTAYTPALLAILARYNIPATFFVVGTQAEKHPELIRAEVAAGHVIGNHTYHHVSLPKIPQIYVADEIKACGDIVKAITGKAPHLFRPPGGEYNQQVAEASSALGYTMVLWTDDPGDYASPGEQVIFDRTVGKATNGGILLLHDGIQQTVNILPKLIETLQAQGYRFVTVEELSNGGKK